MNPINPAQNGTDVLLIGLAFMAVVFLIAYIRNMEARRVRKLFSDDEILLSAFNVQFFGVESVKGRPLRSTGVLILTGEGIYYRAKFLNRSLMIKGDTISSFTAVSEFKGRNMYTKFIAINFVNSNGERDRAGFRIPYPERWLEAVTRLFLHPADENETGE